MVTIGCTLLSVPQEDNVGEWERPPAPAWGVGLPQPPPGRVQDTCGSQGIPQLVQFHQVQMPR